MEITARFIFEVIGGPKEHVENTLKEAVQKLRDDINVHISNNETYEAVKLKENNLWSAYADVELQVDSVTKLLNICFDYTPSSVEILEPAGLELDTNEIAELLNDLLAKLHNYNLAMHKISAELKVTKQKAEALEKYTQVLQKKLDENFKIKKEK